MSSHLISALPIIPVTQYIATSFDLTRVLITIHLTLALPDTPVTLNNAACFDLTRV